jgi:uncharacterized protein (DUF3820 family)
MEKLEIYNKLKAVPDNAKKIITGGRLKGMTDIKPMWRIEKLTEMFGPCGIGWKAPIKSKQIIEGANGEKIAVVDIELFIKYEDKWSEAIDGTGGSIFVANEKNGLYTSDECFKMAYTDAISVACKSLGMGADVYWGDSKYKTDCKEEEPQEITLDYALEYKLNFGKYEGKTLVELTELDPNYCNWLYNNEKTDETIKKCLKLIANSKVKLEE